MPNTLPQKFKVKTSQSRDRSRFLLHHNHLTTTDFFKIMPVVARKVEPNDSMRVDCTSFVRLFPMPFPVFGRIRYYNRCFFVPYRQIMEGFNEFITDTQYNTSNGYVKIQSVPWFTDKDICDAFMASLTDAPAGRDALIESVDDLYYWRKVIFRDNPDYYQLVDNSGAPVVYHGTNDTDIIFLLRPDNNQVQEVSASLSPLSFDSYSGTYTVATSQGVTVFTLNDTHFSSTYSFRTSDSSEYPGQGSFIVSPTISTTNYDDLKYDFRFNALPDPIYYRFTNVGRHFYNVLTSLKYRVSFSNAGGSFTNTQKRSAGKLLAYLKVYLDWYHPSAYSEENELRMLFRGVASAGRHVTYQQLMLIAYGLDYACYERDYFTGAWQNPTGPNVSMSQVEIDDTTVVNYKSASSYNERSKLVNYPVTDSAGSQNGTPTLIGSYLPSQPYQPSTRNVSYYMIEQLRALTNKSRRAQLTGNRAVDRYLSQYGVKLDDDQVNRCYYIGGYHYDADIMDIMSTADTDQAALGDYAGKGIAYSDAHRDFNFDSGNEHGFIIVVSSVVPSVGYVQGIDRENLQLTKYDFFDGDFDNLGTQPQLNEELFADAGMVGVDGENHPYTVAPDGVRGFVPRYIEEKIGFDNLTGDFNIPSRREGMDAFHLFRLFKDGNILSINKGFLIGEQKQYDRIFNNTSDDYDHMWVEHHVLIDAYRNMKSVNDIYDFEHSDGKEIEVDANGTQIS